MMILPQVRQSDPPALPIQSQPLAAEPDRAGHEIAVRRAPVFVPERVIPDVVHAAKHETGLPVDLFIQVHAQPAVRQIVEQRFQGVEIVVPKNIRIAVQRCSRLSWPPLSLPIRLRAGCGPRSGILNRGTRRSALPFY